MINTYSLKSDGNKRVKPNFKVKEFACKDGSDTVLIDSLLADFLQCIRDCFGATSVHISSAFRTASYNYKIGGSVTSKHLRGMAADFCTRKNLLVVSPVKVACVAELLGAGGIEQINDTNLHIDTRTNEKWYTIQSIKNGKRVYTKLTELGFKSWFSYGKMNLDSLGICNPFDEPLVTVSKGDKGNNARWVQYQLIRSGCLPLLIDGVCSCDGSFGARSERALILFQKTHHLEVDGRCGRQTREALKRY